MNYSNQQNRTEQNGTEWHQLSSTECIAWLAVSMTEAFAIVTLNIVTIIVFTQNRSLRKRSIYSVINLAVADMFVGGFAEVMDFIWIGIFCKFRQYNVAYNGIWDHVIANMQLLFQITSLTNITAISLERLHATFFPFKHRVIRKWIFGVIITVVWVTAALLTTVVRSWWFGISWKIYYTWHAFNIICLLVILVSYASIAVKIHCEAHPRHHGGASRERKLTKTLFIVTLVSLLMWLPYVIFILIFTGDTFITSLLEYRLHYSLVVLFYANSIVNPILYTFGMPEFKRALVSLFRRSVQQQGQVQVFPLRSMWM